MEDWNIHSQMYSITRVAIILNCSPITIKRWYKWASLSDEPLENLNLPQYQTDKRGTWYFNSEQIKQLQDFRKNLKWGRMSNLNSKYYWSNKKGESNE